MTPTEIITRDPHSQKFGAEKVLASIAKLVKSGQAILLRKNDSVCLAIKIAPETVEIHLYTQDRPIALAMAIRYFKEKFIESDIKKVYGTEPEAPAIIKLMASVGINVQPSDNPDYAWMADAS
jgi:xanthine/CO dehydrogenase XdhC/CoxF family maturation factor